MPSKNSDNSPQTTSGALPSTPGVDGSNRNDVRKAVIRFAIDMGPLATFFSAYFLGDIFVATGAYIVVTVLALGAGFLLERRLAPVPILTGVIVVFFGGLTLVVEDSQFIKMKPTILNALFAAILLIGLSTGRSYLRYLFGDVFSLTEEGWKVLTLRWACFFLFLAVLNEIVWRNFSESTWVTFKFVGIAPLTAVFGMLQVPLLTTHAPDEVSEDSPPEHSSED